MNAIVVNDFEFRGRAFNKGEIYEVKPIPSRPSNDDGVFINGKRFCDVGSPLFNENFKLIEMCPKCRSNYVNKDFGMCESCR